MISVKRAAPPEVFTKKKHLISKEIKDAKAAIFANPKPAKEFKFGFYTRNKNFYKEDLVNMFHQRCAYCECLVTVGNRGDIEHFRPKGESVNKDGVTVKPGYYWLAADWNNLYLSCTNCNQNTGFKVIDPNDPTKLIEKTGGKMNQFALQDEKFRLKHELQTLEEEEPYRLLIDPCRDKPEQLLDFQDSGVVKTKQKTGIAAERASYSIDVFMLQREILVKVRRERYLVVMDKIVYIRKFSPYVIKDIKARNKSARHMLDREQLEKTFMQLMELLDVNNIKAEYIALSRQYSNSFITEYGNTLTDLLGSSNTAKPWYAAAQQYFEPQVKALKNYYESL